MKTLVFLAASAFALAFTQAALAEDFQTVVIGGNFQVRDSETKSLALDGVRRVKNLVIQAEGIQSDSVVEVMVNGQVKGTLYAPGRDPSYVVTVEETARSIEFRHRSGGAMRVIQVFGTVSYWSKPIDGNGDFRGDSREVRELAKRALREVEFLRAFSVPEEDNTYLYPIKKNAGLVLVMSDAHGNLSKQTIRQLTALVDQIDFANPYLGRLMQQEGAFESVVELLTVRETIADLLN